MVWRHWILLGLLAVAQTAPASPRNVILIIGDGMDEQQLTLARNYLAGATGTLPLDRLPLRATVQVLTIEDRERGAPVYVADSANTATAMATGQVTSRGRLATAAGTDRPLTTIVELAAAAGYRTGLVTTSSVTDATPAAFIAHINFRLCMNPEMMQEVVYRELYLGECRAHLKAEGGSGSIAEQLAESPLDVILGGGREHFKPAIEGGTQSVESLARNRGFTVLHEPQALAGVAPGQRLLGLFAEGDLPVRLRGEDGREAEAVRPSLLHRLNRYLGEVTLPEPMLCEANPDFAGTPDLKTLTETALRQLSRDNDKGFFLMVESASIDKQAHRRRPCGSIGEVEQLNEALASALAFATEQPQTLVLVTADHSQAAQIVPDQSLFYRYPVPIYSPGKLARIRTPEGAVIAVNYATSNFFMEEHTGAAVPLFGNAVARERVPPFLRQPELFTIMTRFLGLD